MCYHSSVSVGRIANIRLPTIICIMLILVLTITSCDNEWPDDYCNCQQGGTIGGWEDPNDTTITDKKDSIGDIEVILNNWQDSEKHNIHL